MQVMVAVVVVVQVMLVVVAKSVVLLVLVVMVVEVVPVICYGGDQEPNAADTSPRWPEIHGDRAKQCTSRIPRASRKPKADMHETSLKGNHRTCCFDVTLDTNNASSQHW